MAQIKLRPNSETAVSGWSTSPVYTRWNDNDTGTTSVQNQTGCSITLGLDELSIDLSSINYITVYIHGVAGRSGASDVTIKFVDSDGDAYGQEVLSFSSIAGYENGAEVSENAAGGALAKAYINASTLLVDPDTQGITISEVYVLVDYEAAAAAPFLHGLQLDQGFIQLSNGKISI